MQRTGLSNNLVHCRGDARFLHFIRVDGEKPVGEALGESMEVVGCVADVEGVDTGCVVDEARFSDSETDATVCAGYWAG